MRRSARRAAARPIPGAGVTCLGRARVPCPARQGAHPGRRLGQPLLRQLAVAYRPHQGVAQPQHGGLVGQPAAHADGVGAGRDGQDAAALQAVGGGDGLHLHPVGDDQPVEAEPALVGRGAQQAVQRCRAQGGGAAAVQGRQQDVGAHHGSGAGRDGGAERHEFTFLEGGQVGGDARQVVVGVDGGVAVAGEVLGAGGDAGGLQALDVGGGVPGDQLRVGAEGADTDDGVGRVGVDVGRGRPVEGDAAFGETAAEFPGDVAGQVGVVDGAEREVAGKGGTAAHLQAGDVAALLVDGDQDVLACAPQLRGEGGELRGGGDVAAEQAHRGESFAEAPQQPVGGGGAGEARLEDGQGVAGEGVGGAYGAAGTNERSHVGVIPSLRRR